MKKAFSLTELLVTLSIIVVVVAVVLVSYNGLRERSQAVVQEDVQRNFLRALEMFSSSGGNPAAILSDGSLTPTDQGHALLEALQQSASSTRRNATGQVGNLIPDNAIVAASSEDGTPRLVPSAGGINLATSGTGFVVTLDPSATIAPKANPAAVTAAVTTAVSGTAVSSSYASTQQYLWDVDTAVQGGPGGPAVSTGVSTGASSGSEIVIAFGAKKSGSSNPTSLDFSFNDYTDPGTTIEVFAYRRDGSPLTTADANLVISFPDAGGNYVSTGGASAATRAVNGNSISSSGTTVNGLIIVMRPETSKPATTWTNNSYALRATVTGSVTGIGTTNSARNVRAVPQQLAAPEINFATDVDGDGIMDYTVDQIVVNSATPNGSIIPSPAAVVATILSAPDLSATASVNGVVTLTNNP